MSNELKVGSVYKLSGQGTVIYCGVKVGGKLLALRPMAKPTNIIYLDKSFSSRLLPVVGKIYDRLAADFVHDKGIILKKDLLFFQQSHGVFVGEVAEIWQKTCLLKVGDKINRVSLNKLFTYDQIIGGMQARVILRGALSCGNNANTKHEVSEASGC